MAVQLASGPAGDHGTTALMTVTVCHDNADAAFRSLYAEHGPALLRLSTMLTEGDRHRAKLDIQHYSTRAWLITVARHLAVDAHRARQSRPAEAELDDQLALAGGQQPDASLDEVSVRTAIAHLPGPQRQVLTEIHYRDRSLAET